MQSGLATRSPAEYAEDRLIAERVGVANVSRATSLFADRELLRTSRKIAIMRSARESLHLGRVIFELIRILILRGRSSAAFLARLRVALLRNSGDRPSDQHQAQNGKLPVSKIQLCLKGMRSGATPSRVIISLP